MHSKGFWITNFQAAEKHQINLHFGDVDSHGYHQKENLPNFFDGSVGRAVIFIPIFFDNSVGRAVIIRNPY